MEYHYRRHAKGRDVTQFEYWLLLATVLIAPHVEEPFAKKTTLFCLFVAVTCAAITAFWSFIK